ncbi:hypothetical protein [Reichenbachiella sp.]|uniref:hypothetical protein n=1 Tax=Reichenbachiella sp. TaxID=2184521 RepID=UPI003B59227D
MNQKVRDIAQALSKQRMKLMPTFTATVKEVDEATMTCVVEPPGQAEIDEVRLKAGIDEVTDGIVEFPTVGSTVLCGIIGQDEDICFVIKCSVVDKIVMNGGSLKGLIIHDELVAQLTKMTARIDGIIDAIGDGVPAPQDGGSALQATIVAGLAALNDVEDFSNIENDKVKH